ncbi:alpha3-fucosyltransferase [Reticulomyxa filosa]|uniref:Fucosyltransferase n=1 Tax=Reticulomyxa filosa TaxID=46433 RepID=X6MJV1_RETFI|nr:alpha3-fucosyltransferase [Reticulomyxa filosa]|eukprot:ETO14288.1 alpha3-fucosyltransferase [Reticulomyxa filosa]
MRFRPFVQVDSPPQKTTKNVDFSSDVSEINSKKYRPRALQVAAVSAVLIILFALISLLLESEPTNAEDKKDVSKLLKQAKLEYKPVHWLVQKQTVNEINTVNEYSINDKSEWPEYLKVEPNKNSPLAKNPRYEDIDIVILYKSTVFGGRADNSFLRSDFKTYVCNITNDKDPSNGHEDSPGKPLLKDVKVLLTADTNLMEYAHGYVYHGPDVPYGRELSEGSKEGKRVRIYHTMESPALTSVSLTLESVAQQFQLLMSYHFKSDIFLPYVGRGTLRLLVDRPILVPFHEKNSEYPLAWIGSNCNAQNGRQAYLGALFKHIPTHSYGGCLNTIRKSVPRGGESMLKIISQYKFYIVMENSNCEDYITEKLGSAIISSTVPVVFSINGSLPNYDRYLPEHSYINAFDFPSAKHLAEYLLKVSQNETLYNSYLWYKFEAMKSNKRKEQIWKDDILKRYLYKETRNHWCRAASSIFNFLYYNSNKTLHADNSCQRSRIMTDFI